MEPSNNNSDYLAIVSAVNRSNLNGTKVPFFIESNSSIIKAYYNDGSATYELLLPKNSTQLQTRLVARK